MAIRINKAIFLHIPKTGGTWLRNYFRETGMILEEIGLTHVNGVGLTTHIKDSKDLIFCFVRHPLTWYRSYWQSKQEIPGRRGGYLDTIVDLTFYEFLDNILTNQPGYLTEFYEGYTSNSHLIGKQENLRVDLKNILDLLKIPYHENHLYKKVNENVVLSEKKYTYEIAMAIMKAENKIIEKYNYNYIPLEVLE